MSSASSRTFEDVKVGVRCKIAALWVAMLFLFAYGDIFGFFRKEQIEDVLAGEISGMSITQFLVPEHRRECPAAADRLVRLDMAQAGGDTLRLAPAV